MEDEFKQETEQVWLLIRKADGWLAYEGRYEDELPTQRGFEKVEATKIENFVKEYSRFAHTESWYPISAEYVVPDGRVIVHVETGTFLVDQETANKS